MRKSLIVLVSALLLSTAVFGATEARAQTGVGCCESGTWVIGPQVGPTRTIVRPSGRVDTVTDWGAHRPYGAYGQPYYPYVNPYTAQYNAYSQDVGNIIGGFRALFGND